MFNAIVFMDVDNATINPFVCKSLSSFIHESTVVMTESMFNAINGFDELCVGIKRAVIVGSAGKNTAQRFGVVEVGDRATLIKHVKARKTGDEKYWFLGDMNTMNEFIWTGLVSDVHVIKNQAMEKPINQVVKWSDYAVNDGCLFNYSLLSEQSMQFEQVSRVKSIFGQNQIIKHFVRRNVEESKLLDTMRDILKNGFVRPNRTGVNTRSIFGKLLEYEMVERTDPVTGKLSYRLPLLTTKRMFTRGVFEELKWFLGGGTNAHDLMEKGVSIWNGNTTREFLDSRELTDYHAGETGPIYGFQWRHWGAEYTPGIHDYAGEGINQISRVIQSLKEDPFSRRHIISGWNVADLNKMCLPPCHVLYQFLVHEKRGQKYLSLMMYQRSCDVFLGLPFNVCSMGMFLMLMSHQVGYKPHKIIHSIADMHIYETHIDAANEQMKREPRSFPFISIECDQKESIGAYDYEDIKIVGYNAHSSIKADMIA